MGIMNLYLLTGINTFLAICFYSIYKKTRHYGVLLDHDGKYIFLTVTFLLMSWILLFVSAGKELNQKIYFMCAIGLCIMVNWSLLLSLFVFSPSYFISLIKKKSVDKRRLLQIRLAFLVAMVVNMIALSGIILATVWVTWLVTNK